MEVPKGPEVVEAAWKGRTSGLADWEAAERSVREHEFQYKIFT